MILEVDESLDMSRFHMIADGRVLSLEEVRALTGGHVTVIPDDAVAKDGRELLFRKQGRGRAGTLISRYLRREDETDMALLRRRARGEQVPAIPEGEVLHVVLERRLEAVKPARLGRV